jgi:hypothetical protein
MEFQVAKIFYKVEASMMQKQPRNYGCFKIGGVYGAKIKRVKISDSIRYGALAPTCLESCLKIFANFIE